MMRLICAAVLALSLLLPTSGCSLALTQRAPASTPSTDRAPTQTRCTSHYGFVIADGLGLLSSGVMSAGMAHEYLTLSPDYGGEGISRDGMRKLAIWGGAIAAVYAASTVLGAHWVRNCKKSWLG